MEDLLDAEPETTEAMLRQHLVLGKEGWKTLLIDPHISAKKLSNARSSCGVPLSERVIGLFDLTFFGSASEALIFGVSGIYFRTKRSPVTIAYSELNQFTVACRPGLTISSAGSEFGVMGAIAGEEAVELLQSVQALFE